MQKVAVSKGKVTLKLTGNLNISDALILRETLSGYLAEGHKAFVIDLSDVHDIDGAGLGGLVGIQDQLSKRGGHFIFKGQQGISGGLFELVQHTHGAKNPDYN